MLGNVVAVYRLFSGLAVLSAHCLCALHGNVHVAPYSAELVRAAFVLSIEAYILPSQGGAARCDFGDAAKACDACACA